VIWVEDICDVGGEVKVAMIGKVWDEYRTYSAVDDIVIPCIVVDVYRYASQRRDFRGEFIEAGVVLLFALVGLRHCCAGGVCVVSRLVRLCFEAVKVLYRMLWVVSLGQKCGVCMCWNMTAAG
jgi:hypothetical protein